MNHFIKPNWKKSNLNITATLAEFLGAKNTIPTLPKLKKELAKNYKNVVFICFDGLGMNPININLNKNQVLRKNIKQVLTSTFPSTTTNATTSLMQNQYPLEHGWFGWSMYFKEIDKNVDIFKNTNSLNGEKLEIKSSPLGNLDYYFNHAKSEYQINSIFPSYVKVQKPEINHTFNNMDEFFNILREILLKPEKQFVYSYYPDPDATMHDYGVSSFEAKYVINEINKKTQNLINETKNTLFVITADHGQVDVKGYVEIYKDKTLNKMLKTPAFMEARAPAFLVKEGKEKEFETYFKKTYSKDFKLYKSSYLLKKGYFGKVGNKQDLLGDYIAIGTNTNKQALLTPIHPHFKGHHTSLTKEMLVPLILINN